MGCQYSYPTNQIVTDKFTSWRIQHPSAKRFTLTDLSIFIADVPAKKQDEVVSQLFQRERELLSEHLNKG